MTITPAKKIIRNYRDRFEHKWGWLRNFPAVNINELFDDIGKEIKLAVKSCKNK